MARDLGELNREEYARYKDDVKKEGKGFFPFAMWHDTVMSFVVVCVIAALAAIWYFDADGVEPGLLGPWYTEPADPGTTDFIPRPDWYFYFLFYLLRIFEWPETVFIATVGIPTICLILLLGLPFYDRRREQRPTHRPVAMVAAVLTDPVDGRSDVEGRDREGGARLRAPPPRSFLGPGAGLRRRPAGGRRAPSCSRSRAASTATPTSGRARGPSARPTSRRSGRRTTPSTSSATSPTRPRSGTA